MSSKITIIGAGSVGSTIAYTLAHDEIASEIVLIDINKEKVEGEVMDIEQGTCFRSPVSLVAGDYADAKDSDIVIITYSDKRKHSEEHHSSDRKRSSRRKVYYRKQPGRYYDLCIYQDFRSSGESDHGIRNYS